MLRRRPNHVGYSLRLGMGVYRPPAIVYVEPASQAYRIPTLETEEDAV